jgi:glutamyl-tRNA reductase
MIVVVGLSHHTAAIEVREQVALDEGSAKTLGRRLELAKEIEEVFVISTCNRVEIVVSTSDESEAALEACAAECRRALVERCAEAETAIYKHHGKAAVRHLVRVAASLDSLVVGEAQILGQMKEGFEQARTAGTVGSTLHQLFACATRGARRVRTETSVGIGQVSIPSIAVDLASQIFGELSGRRAALIGLGEMGQSVARLLADAGASLSVVGRTMDKAMPVAERFSGRAYLMENLPEVLAEVDVVVSATSAKELVVRPSDLVLRRKVRRGGNLFFIDLAVPRDIDPEIGKIGGVFLYDVDDLSQVADQSTGSRRKAARAAEKIVDEVVEDWERRESALLVTPTIKALRAKMRAGLEAELVRSLRGGLRDLNPEQRKALARMLDSSLNRILHDPTTRLREEASQKGGGTADLIALVDELFDLSDVPVDELDVAQVRVPVFDSLVPPSVSRPTELHANEGEDSSAADSDRPSKGERTH